MIQDFIKDLLKYLPAQIAPAIMGLITIPIITRLFPPADYGNYILVTATVSIFATIVGWLGMSIIRFYPVYEQDGRLPVIYGTVVRWLLVSVAVLAAIFLGISFVVKAHRKIHLYHLMLIGTLLFVFTAVFEVLQQFLRSKRWAGLYSAFSIWKNAVGLLVGLGLAMGLGCGVEALLWGSVLSSIVALPFLWRSVLGKTRWKETNSVGLAREMAKYGFPLVVGNLAGWILSLSDRYVLEFFRGAQEVGIYSISYTISEKSIVLLTSMFMFASGPISMSVWEKEGVAKSQEFLTKLTRYYLIICLPIVVGLSVLARPVVELLTAPAYYEGFRIVPLVALGGFFLGLQQRFQSGLAYYKKTHLIMVSIVASGLLNLGLNVFLIPKYGYIAAAATTLVSYVFLVVMIVVMSRKYFVWKFPFRSLGNTVCASVVMIVAIYPISNSLTSSTLINLVAGICIGVVVYFLMLFFLREPQKEEIQAMGELGSRIVRRISR